jgi:hypothetical protein
MNKKWTFIKITLISCKFLVRMLAGGDTGREYVSSRLGPFQKSQATVCEKFAPRICALVLRFAEKTGREI